MRERLNMSGHKPYHSPLKVQDRREALRPETAGSADIAVIGAGASGCMAAVSAGMESFSENKAVRIILFDRNEKTGRKIYATGNGRCNLTNLKIDRNCYHVGGEEISALFGIEQTAAGQDAPQQVNPGQISPERIKSEQISPERIKPEQISPEQISRGQISRGQISPERDLVRTAIEQFGPAELTAFMEDQGIFLHSRNGFVYPRTDQASTIAEAFEKKLRELGVEIKLGDAVTSVSEVHRSKAGKTGGENNKSDGKRNGDNGCGLKQFLIRTASGKIYLARKIVLACGGMAGPQYGCTGDGYIFAAGFGHTVNKPIPALVQLHSPDRLLGRCSGVRCDALLTLWVGRADSDPADRNTGPGVCRDGERTAHVRSDWRAADCRRGELQMTEHGISGIPVFQFSAIAGRALREGRKVLVRIDFLPEFTREGWDKEIARRLAQNRNCTLESFFLGLINRRILNWILECRGLQAEKKAFRVSDNDLRAVMNDMRDMCVEIDGTGNFQQAQTTGGGVPLAEIDRHFASRITDGLYLTGELLDVDGICGGYNLQWAMTSGRIAGAAAFRSIDM